MTVPGVMMRVISRETSPFANEAITDFLGDGSVKETVGTYTWTNSFTFNITNMFGRYGSTSTLVCWNGEMDYIRVSARTK